MIWATRTLTCDFCGEWRSIDDTETAREARARARLDGWRVLPNANRRGRLIDACPKHPHEPAPAAPTPGETEDDACLCGHAYAAHTNPTWANGLVTAHGARCNLCFGCNIYRRAEPVSVAAGEDGAL